MTGGCGRSSRAMSRKMAALAALTTSGGPEGVRPQESLVASWPRHRPSRRQGRARDRSQDDRSRRSLPRRRRS